MGQSKAQLADVSSTSACNHQVVLPEVEFNCHTPKNPATATVVKSELCTAAGVKSASFIRHIEFDVGNTALDGAMRAGQCFGVIPPGNNEKGKPHKVRLYSMGSPTRGEDGQGAVISTAVKRVVDEDKTQHRLLLGVTSNFLCDLQVGDQVQLTGPVGKRFLLPVNAQDYNYVFFATGTGIVPFRGLAIDLLEAGVTSPIVLISGAPYASDLCYDGQFKCLADQYENFKYITAISREKQADGLDKMYVHDRIVALGDDFLSILQRENTLVYMCGLTGMELGIYQALARVLTKEQLSHYLEMACDVASPDSWDRAMINRQIKRTDHVYAEVYD